MKKYIGMISSDWSQCLSPNGPFDGLIFHYPEARRELESIFNRYTGNEISLGQATRQVKGLLPGLLSQNQMAQYLDKHFATYPGVAELIHWCHANRILFMINTTGFMGYFQIAIRRKLLPPVGVLSAHSMLRFEADDRAAGQMVGLEEIEDKASNTAAVVDRFSIDHRNIVIVGDSGGDGPHFEWGAAVGATLVGSMTKPSLDRFCRERGVAIDHRFGHSYEPGEPISPDSEGRCDFRSLIDIVAPTMGLSV